jgi:prophage regulatory protein
MRSSQQVEPRNEPRARPEPTQRNSPFGERESARILRLKQVAAIVGIGRSSIYRKVQEGTFPSPIKLGSARASGWISAEVYDWVDEQIRRCRRSAYTADK